MSMLKNPFPGLRSFNYEESHLFFGREQHIRDLLGKLNTHHFVAIVGTSGSGKSSLVRAGLLPAINSRNGDQDAWIITTMKPGNAPVHNMARSLLSDGVFGSSNDAEKSAKIIEMLQASSLGLVQVTRNLIAPGKKLLILLDQFEETFRYSGSEIEKNDVESEQFVRLIIDAVRQRDVPIYVVLTVRSDFLGDCARFEGLPEAINDGHYLVPRLNGEQNKLAITGPVNYAGGKISPRLVQRLINDLGDNPDQLPVLQHALMRTWDNWVASADTGEPMDIRHYEMTGTMLHALSRHADEAFEELKSDRQKKLVEKVFKTLTVKSGESRGVRRPSTLKSLCEITGAPDQEIAEVLKPFRKHGRSFILPDESGSLNSASVVDISHESLMRAWERMRKWVDEESESADIYMRLCQSARLHQSGQAALWRDPELHHALDWKERNKPNTAWAMQYNPNFEIALSFLEESRVERDRQVEAKRKRTNLVRSAVIAFMVVVSGLTAWALFQTKTANENFRIAEQKTEEALNQKDLAEKAKEMAMEASRQAMDAQSYAELQSNIAGEQKKMAEQQKSKAEMEAQRAMQQEQEALRQKQLAEQKSREALNEKQRAEESQSEADRLRLLSVSENIAFKSIQQKDDPQLAALLALQAYKLSSDNGGNLNDQQLYNAVYSAAQKVDPNFKPEKIRGMDEISGIYASGNNLLTLSTDGNTRIYNTSDFGVKSEVRLPGLPSSVNAAFLSDDGKYGAFGMEDNTVLIYDVKSGSQPKTLAGHQGLLRAVAFSDDASVIATGARDSAVIIWKNYTQFKKIKFQARIKSLAFSADNSKLFIGSEDGLVSQYMIGSEDKQSFASSVGNRVQSIKCGASGKNIAVGYSNGTLQVLDSKGNLMRTINETGSVDFILMDDQKDLLVTATARKLIHIYRLSDLSQKPIEIKVANSVTALTMNNGEFLYAACSDRVIRRYPVKTSWIEKILTSNIKREFTKEEWITHVGDDVPRNK
jgi:energy-coupling factor transporter ATP-binding protein EcfA2